MFSDLIGPSSGAFCRSCICRLWYVVLLCVLLDTSSWTCLVVRVLVHTKSANTACKTLLMMDQWGPKHVELKLKSWLKLIHWDHIVYLVGLYICVWEIMWHKTTTVKNIVSGLQLSTYNMYRIFRGWKASGGVVLTTHSHLTLRLQKM